MRKLLILLFTLPFVLGLMAQDKVGDVVLLSDVPESKALVMEAKNYANAVIDGNYDLVANLTHEDVVKMGGGKDFIIMDLKAEGDQFKAQGFTYASSEVGTHPEFLKSENQLQTIIPVKYQLSLKDSKVESWIKLFATSTDEGKTWKFVNLEKFDEASLREFVSNVSPELVYPTN